MGAQPSFLDEVVQKHFNSGRYAVPQRPPTPPAAAVTQQPVFVEMPRALPPGRISNTAAPSPVAVAATVPIAPPSPRPSFAEYAARQSQPDMVVPVPVEVPVEAEVRPSFSQYVEAQAALPAPPEKRQQSVVDRLRSKSSKAPPSRILSEGMDDPSDIINFQEKESGDPLKSKILNQRVSAQVSTPFSKDTTLPTELGNGVQAEYLYKPEVPYREKYHDDHSVPSAVVGRGQRSVDKMTQRQFLELPPDQKLKSGDATVYLTDTVPMTGSISRTMHDIFDKAGYGELEVPTEMVGLPRWQLADYEADLSGLVSVDTRPISERWKTGDYGYSYSPMEPVSNDPGDSRDLEFYLTDRALEHRFPGYDLERQVDPYKEDRVGEYPHLYAYYQDIIDKKINPLVKDGPSLLSENEVSRYQATMPFGTAIRYDQSDDRYELRHSKNATRFGDALTGSDLRRRTQDLSKALQQTGSNQIAEGLAPELNTRIQLIQNEAELEALNTPDPVAKQKIYDSANQMKADLVRRYNQRASELQQGIIIPRLEGQVENPVQLDLNQSGNKLRAVLDAEGRQRSSKLDAQAVQASNERAGTLDYIIKNKTPEYHLWSSAEDTDDLAEPTRGSSHILDFDEVSIYHPTLVKLSPAFQAKPQVIRRKGGVVGLGLDIDRKNPRTLALLRSYIAHAPQRFEHTATNLFSYTVPKFFLDALLEDPYYADASLNLRYPREFKGAFKRFSPSLIPVDPQFDTYRRLLATEGTGNFSAEQAIASAHEIQWGQTPEQQILDDEAAAQLYTSLSYNLLDSSAERQVKPSELYRQMNTYNRLAKKHSDNARRLKRAMQIVNEQTAPDETVLIRRLRLKSDGGTAFTTGWEEVPYEEAVRRQNQLRLTNTAQPILKIPHRAPVEKTWDIRALQEAAAKGEFYQTYGAEDSVSILTDANVDLFKQIQEADPHAKQNQLRRGVIWGETPPIYGQKKIEGPVINNTGDLETETEHKRPVVIRGPQPKLISAGEPVMGTDGQPMYWKGEAIHTYNPDEAGRSDVYYSRRPREDKAIIKKEDWNQRQAAIEEGYVPKVPRAGLDSTVTISPGELKDIRGGRTQEEALDLTRHNRVRKLLRMSPASENYLDYTVERTGVPLSERSLNLVLRPPGSFPTSIGSRFNPAMLGLPTRQLDSGIFVID